MRISSYLVLFSVVLHVGNGSLTKSTKSDFSPVVKNAQHLSSTAQHPVLKIGKIVHHISRKVLPDEGHFREILQPIHEHGKYLGRILRRNKREAKVPTKKPVCTTDGVFEHPDGCDKYFKCSKAGKRYRMFQFDCATGTLFNQAKGLCLPAAPADLKLKCMEASFIENKTRSAVDHISSISAAVKIAQTTTPASITTQAPTTEAPTIDTHSIDQNESVLGRSRRDPQPATAKKTTKTTVRKTSSSSASSSDSATPDSGEDEDNEEVEHKGLKTIQKTSKTSSSSSSGSSSGGGQTKTTKKVTTSSTAQSASEVDDDDESYEVGFSGETGLSKKKTITKKVTTSSSSSSSGSQHGNSETLRNSDCKAAGLFIHPSNCHKYFRCDKVGSRFRLFKFDCKSAEVFDEDSKKCTPRSLMPASWTCQGEETASSVEITSSKIGGKKITKTTVHKKTSSTAAGDNEEEEEDSTEPESQLSKTKTIRKITKVTKKSSSAAGEDEEENDDEDENTTKQSKTKIIKKTTKTSHTSGSSGSVPGDELDTKPETSEGGAKLMITKTVMKSKTKTTKTATTGETSEAEHDDNHKEKIAMASTRIQKQTSDVLKNSICTKDGQFAHPNGCHKYYKCHKAGKRFHLYKFDCEADTYFDAALDKCETMANLGPSWTCNTGHYDFNSESEHDLYAKPKTETIEREGGANRTITKTVKKSKGGVGESVEESDVSDEVVGNKKIHREKTKTVNTKSGEESGENYGDQSGSKKTKKIVTKKTTNTSSSSTTGGDDEGEDDDYEESGSLSKTKSSRKVVKTTKQTKTTLTGGKRHSAEDDEDAKETRIQGSTSDILKNSICTKDGQFAHPNGCHKYYKCHKSGRRFQLFQFNCEPAMFFDETLNKCETRATLGPSWTCTTGDIAHVEALPEKLAKSICTSEGYFVHPKHCNKYYRCIEDGPNDFKLFDFNCGHDMIFDDSQDTCVTPSSENREQICKSSKSKHSTNIKTTSKIGDAKSKSELESREDFDDTAELSKTKSSHKTTTKTEHGEDGTKTVRKTSKTKTVTSEGDEYEDSGENGLTKTKSSRTKTKMSSSSSSSSGHGGQSVETEAETSGSSQTKTVKKLSKVVTEGKEYSDEEYDDAVTGLKKTRKVLKKAKYTIDGHEDSDSDATNSKTTKKVTKKTTTTEGFSEEGFDDDDKSKAKKKKKVTDLLLASICTNEGIFIHPHSCAKYYRCTKRGTRFDIFQFNCDRGDVFNEDSKECVPAKSLDLDWTCKSTGKGRDDEHHEVESENKSDENSGIKNTKTRKAIRKTKKVVTAEGRVIDESYEEYKDDNGKKTLPKDLQHLTQSNNKIETKMKDIDEAVVEGKHESEESVGEGGFQNNTKKTEESEYSEESKSGIGQIRSSKPKPKKQEEGETSTSPSKAKKAVTTNNTIIFEDGSYEHDSTDPMKLRRKTANTNLAEAEAEKLKKVELESESEEDFGVGGFQTAKNTATEDDKSEIPAENIRKEEVSDINFKSTITTTPDPRKSTDNSEDYDDSSSLKQTHKSAPKHSASTLITTSMPAPETDAGSPDCSEEGSFDIPGDCMNFYRCTKSGKKLYKTIVSCEEGQVFDEFQYSCSTKEDITKLSKCAKEAEKISKEGTKTTETDDEEDSLEKRYYQSINKANDNVKGGHTKTYNEKPSKTNTKTTLSTNEKIVEETSSPAPLAETEVPSTTETPIPTTVIPQEPAEPESEVTTTPSAIRNEDEYNEDDDKLRKNKAANSKKKEKEEYEDTEYDDDYDSLQKNKAKNENKDSTITAPGPAAPSATPEDYYELPFDSDPVEPTTSEPKDKLSNEELTPEPEPASTTRPDYGELPNSPMDDPKLLNGPIKDESQDEELTTTMVTTIEPDYGVLPLENDEPLKNDQVQSGDDEEIELTTTEPEPEPQNNHENNDYDYTMITTEVPTTEEPEGELPLRQVELTPRGPNIGDEDDYEETEITTTIIAPTTETVDDYSFETDSLPKTRTKIEPKVKKVEEKEASYEDEEDIQKPTTTELPLLKGLIRGESFNSEDQKSTTTKLPLKGLISEESTNSKDQQEDDYSTTSRSPPLIVMNIDDQASDYQDKDKDDHGLKARPPSKEPQVKEKNEDNGEFFHDHQMALLIFIILVILLFIVFFFCCCLMRNMHHWAIIRIRPFNRKYDSVYLQKGLQTSDGCVKTQTVLVDIKGDESGFETTCSKLLIDENEECIVKNIQSSKTSTTRTMFSEQHSTVNIVNIEQQQLKQKEEIRLQKQQEEIQEMKRVQNELRIQREVKEAAERELAAAALIKQQEEEFTRQKMVAKLHRSKREKLIDEEIDEEINVTRQKNINVRNVVNVNRTFEENVHVSHSSNINTNTNTQIATGLEALKSGQLTQIVQKSNAVADAQMLHCDTSEEKVSKKTVESSKQNFDENQLQSRKTVVNKENVTNITKNVNVFENISQSESEYHQGSHNIRKSDNTFVPIVHIPAPAILASSIHSCDKSTSTDDHHFANQQCQVQDIKNSSSVSNPQFSTQTLSQNFQNLSSTSTVDISSHVEERQRRQQYLIARQKQREFDSLKDIGDLQKPLEVLQLLDILKQQGYTSNLEISQMEGEDEESQDMELCQTTNDEDDVELELFDFGLITTKRQATSIQKSVQQSVVQKSITSSTSTSTTKQEISTIDNSAIQQNESVATGIGNYAYGWRGQEQEQDPDYQLYIKNSY